MDLRGYVRLLSRRWRIVAAATCFGLALGIGLILLSPTTYQAEARVFVSLRGAASDSSGAYQGNLFSQDRVKSYAEVLTLPAVTGPVIAQTKIDLTPEELGKRISATVPTGTVVLRIAVSDPSAVRSRDLTNAVASQFGKVVTMLETPSGSRTSPVVVSVVKPATLPADRTSPRPVLDLTIGLFLGLAAGIGIAVVRDRLDTTLKSGEDLRAASQAPALTEIGYDPLTPDDPLATGAPNPRRTEAYRTLRTNLRFIDVDRPPRVVVVTSAEANVGKSTTAANLALALAEADVRVVLLEGDLRRPRIADYLGIEGAAGLTDVLVGRTRLDDVLQQWDTSTLSVLPSGQIPPNPSELVGSAQMHHLLEELRTRADLVLIDAPPLLPVTDAAVLAQASDGVVLVARYGHTTRDDVTRSLRALDAVSGRLLGTVLTMVPSRRGQKDYYYRTGEEPGVPLLDDLAPEPTPRSAGSSSASASASASAASEQEVPATSGRRR
jgi:polysaccharide biosynthesis transport protein